MTSNEVWLATDLAAGAIAPWAHALRICVTSHTDLRVLHVKAAGDTPWSALPTPRKLLTDWGFIPEDASLDDFNQLRFRVRMRELKAEHPAGLIGAMVEVKAPVLLVLGSHRPSGLARLFDGSVEEEIARRSPHATLVIADGAAPFVDPLNGTVTLRRVLVPVGDGGGEAARDAAVRLAQAVDARQVELVYLHVGDPAAMPTAPETPEGFTSRLVYVRDSSVVSGILQAAGREQVDLIAMATRGHDSWKDALFGSRTERVTREAKVPVLMATLR